MKCTSHRTRPTLEPLEARETPAGIVDVTYARGSVTMVGDAENNMVDVRTNPDGSVWISDPDGTKFRLNGASPDVEVKLPGAITGGMTIHLRDGIDGVTVTNSHVPGSALINGGDGDISILLIGTTIDHNLTVVNGSGYDRLQFSGAVQVGGNITVNNHDGGSTLTIEGQATLSARNLSVTNGTGDDSTYIYGVVKTTGNFSIRNGDGESSLTDSVTTGISIGGTLSVRSGDGTDKVYLENATNFHAGNISIRHGAGTSDSLIMPRGELEVERNISFVGGGDYDRIQFGSSSIPVDVGGSIQINMGKGESIFVVLTSKLNVGGNIGVRGRDGKDTVDLSSAQQGTVGGGVAVSLGSGENQSVQLTGLSIAGGLRIRTTNNTPSSSDAVDLWGIQVGRGTTVRTGAANDRLLVSYCTFLGPFSVSTGAGNDSVGIEAGIYPNGHSTFKGIVTVRTGDGDDSVVVGKFNPPAGFTATAEFAAASFWNGGLGQGDDIDIDSANTFSGPPPVKTGFENLCLCSRETP